MIRVTEDRCEGEPYADIAAALRTTGVVHWTTQVEHEFELGSGLDLILGVGFRVSCHVAATIGHGISFWRGCRHMHRQG